MAIPLRAGGRDWAGPAPKEGDASGPGKFPAPARASCRARRNIARRHNGRNDGRADQHALVAQRLIPSEDSRESKTQLAVVIDDQRLVIDIAD